MCAYSGASSVLEKPEENGKVRHCDLDSVVEQVLSLQIFRHALVNSKIYRYALLYSRVEGFWKKRYTFSVVLLLDLNSKISCLNVASFLGRRASKNLDCYPKISNQKNVKPFFKPATGGGGDVFFDFLKAKNEEKFK